MNYEMLLYTVLFSVVLVGIAFLGLAIRVVLKKNGRFSKKCVSVDLGDGNTVGGCDGCGDKKHSKCPHFESHHGFEGMPAEQFKEVMELK